jgi:hypothetical protein
VEGHVGNLVDKTQADGQRVSPALPKGIKNYLIDIDGTVGEDIPNEEPERMATAEAFPDAIKTINSWYDQGHRICFFTARTEEHRDVTERWLSQKGFHYHTLLMGKPRGGNYHWIDNHVVRATRYTNKFSDLVTKNVEIEVFEE